MKRSRAFLVAGLVILAVIGLAKTIELPFAIEHGLFLGFIFATACTAWSALAGFGGQFSFGHAAVFGLSAYGTFFFDSALGIPPLIGLVVSALLVSFLWAAISTPALRLQGPYFALFTLAAAEIVRHVINAARDQTGGEDGRLLNPTGDGLLYLSSSDRSDFLIWAAVLAVFAVLFFWGWTRSRIGFRLAALRDDRLVAESLGVHNTTPKVMTLAVSGVFTGLAGGLLAYSANIVESEFLLSASVSLDVLVFSIIGGLRSPIGPAVGAMVLVMADQFLRLRFGSSIPVLYPIATAAVFVTSLFVMPAGIVPSFAGWWRSLRRGDSAPDESMSASWGYAPRVAHIEAENDHVVRPETEAVDEILHLLKDHRFALDTNTLGGDDSANSEVILEVNSARKEFGAVIAVHNVSFQVFAGERVGIWGPNGSGKSTLINLIGGQLDLTSGSIRYEGEQLERLGPHARSRMGIARTFQQARVFNGLSVRNNLVPALVSATRLNPLRHRDRTIIDDCVTLSLRAVGLPAETKDRLASGLSTGQRKRLELARLLVGFKSTLLLLDEPTAGLDVDGVPLLQDLLQRLHEHLGTATVVVDHDVDFMRSVCDRVVVMSDGRIAGSVESGNPAFTQVLHSELERATTGGLPT